MIKVSDYIVKRLEEYGVEQAFLIAGGGAMHLDDSFGRSKKIKYLCNHHEQASAMAAEGYARASGKLPVVVVTSGPGGTNTLTGVIGQWLDSVPCLYISGQVKRETMMRDGLRQLGDQEINIIDMVRPVTKYATCIREPYEVKAAINEALYFATEGRPGPVWLDIPLDVQAALVNEEMLSEARQYFIRTKKKRDLKTEEVLGLLSNASRPLILAGHGIRIARAKREFLEFIERCGIPVVTSFNGMDLIPSDHPLFAGRIGTIGTQAGNRALQSCDLLISIGSRNNIRQVSYDWQAFAPQAKKIVVDIDAAELNKPTLKPDIAIQADAGSFIKAMLDAYPRERYFPEADIIIRESREHNPAWKEWREECRMPLDGETRGRGDGGIDPYDFVRTLTSLLPEDAIIVSGNGTASIALHQAGIIKKNTRVIMNSGCAAMGYDLPAAIGACLARVHRPSSVVPPVICITGDGSIQMNIQELQTIAHHNLPIKIFVLNNGGYHSIKQTQDNYFEGRYVGAGQESGVSCPDIIKVARAYGFPAGSLYGSSGMEVLLRGLLAYSGPELDVVPLTQDYTFDKQNLAEMQHAI